MGKDSDFYKNKSKSQKVKLRELIGRLPKCAADYIYSKEMTTQPSTLVSYSYDLLVFFEFMKSNNPTFRNVEIKDIRYDVLSMITSDDIFEYQRYLELNIDPEHPHENDKKAIARKMSPLRGMFHYHMLHKNIKEDPTQLVPLPRLKKDKNIIRMNNFEVQAILNAVKNGNEQMSKRQRAACQRTQLRDFALLVLMLGTGIRVSECNGLDITDVDLKANSFVVVRKGGGQDVLYFGDEIHEALKSYIDSKDKEFGGRKSIVPQEGHEKALFLSIRGTRMSVDAIEQLVKKYSRMVVPNKKITPHKLRSTYGTALYRETGDIRLVADVLGHENINTTIEHYAAIEDEHKRQAVNAVDYNRRDI